MATLNPFEINKKNKNKEEKVSKTDTKIVIENDVIEENLTVKKKKKKKQDESKRTRNQSFFVRFSPDEMKEIEDKFLLSKEKSKADFILKAIRGMKITVIEDLQVTSSELRKQGTNLNQIARSLNQNKYALSDISGNPYLDKKDKELIRKTLAEIETCNNEIEKYKSENIETLNKIKELAERNL